MFLFVRVGPPPKQKNTRIKRSTFRVKQEEEADKPTASVMDRGKTTMGLIEFTDTSTGKTTMGMPLTAPTALLAPPTPVNVKVDPQPPPKKTLPSGNDRGWHW